MAVIKSRLADSTPDAALHSIWDTHAERNRAVPAQFPLNLCVYARMKCRGCDADTASIAVAAVADANRQFGSFVCRGRLKDKIIVKEKILIICRTYEVAVTTILHTLHLTNCKTEILITLFRDKIITLR